ncbi:BamA/TamA family outer membrane protein [Desulfobacca acetoxidans]|uniref:Surface antigen (D15) n=1 Tax=Desulfobacca acetoxidans (strain ATCC 700848 / DSM 11109 / ASRB2) TaxID=880072 RepID=F2NEW1_DESAR|nr:BamA/TamA family outer membrane protein [Desulfobacca acetoxidans]AEB08301.1 surface antigen (D15) [Desulfobacca acetoxidans DSM 11109]HAY22272.1 hypothetical protein [Desulfobacterales bacterium]
MKHWQGWFGIFLLSLASISLSGCSSSFPSVMLPPPLPVERENNQVKSTLFPLPVMATDPNSGEDYGFLPVWVFPRKDKAIGMILAPSAIYNEVAGSSLAFRLLAYPSKETQYRIIVDQSTKINSFYEFSYEKSATQPQEWLYSVLFTYDADIFPRFYGFGNASSSSKETSYTSRNRILQGSFGYRITDNLELCFSETFSQISLSDNHLANLPPTASMFPGVMTDRRNTAVIHEIRCNYDTRDYKDTPTCGFLAKMYVQTARQDLGSDSSYDRLGFEFKGFQPWDSDDRRFITAVRLVGDFMTRESGTPFYRLPTLGGFETDRGYGQWRWIDRNMVAFSLEQRIDVFQLNHFGVVSHWEVAPFIDVGKVFPTFGKFNFHYFHPSAGIALRAVVRPQVVGHVEVGVGRGGDNAVFMGLGYPF